MRKVLLALMVLITACEPGSPAALVTGRDAAIVAPVRYLVTYPVPVDAYWKEGLVRHGVVQATSWVMSSTTGAFKVQFELRRALSPVTVQWTFLPPAGTSALVASGIKPTSPDPALLSVTLLP